MKVCFLGGGGGGGGDDISIYLSGKNNYKLIAINYKYHKNHRTKNI